MHRKASLKDFPCKYTKYKMTSVHRLLFVVSVFAVLCPGRFFVTFLEVSGENPYKGNVPKVQLKVIVKNKIKTFSTNLI